MSAPCCRAASACRCRASSWPTTTKSVIGLNFVLMGKLDGVVLRTLEPALTDTELLSAYAQMGQVLREIHRISMQSFGYIGPNGVWTAHASNRAYMSSQFETKLSEFAERGGDSALGDRLREVVFERADLMDACATAHLCHYDFHSGNILAERKDGSLASVGNSRLRKRDCRRPADGYRKGALLLHAEDEPKKAALMAGYGAIDRRIGRKPSIFIGSMPPWSYGAGWRISAIANRLPVLPRTCGER